VLVDLTQSTEGSGYILGSNLSVAQQANSELGRIIFQGLRSHTFRHTHTHTHKHTVGLLWTTVSEPATNTTHNKHNGRTSMYGARFEPTITAIKPL
jgi:hypothetical protein